MIRLKRLLDIDYEPRRAWFNTNSDTLYRAEKRFYNALAIFQPGYEDSWWSIIKDTWDD